MNIQLKSNKVWSKTPENMQEAILQLKKEEKKPRAEQTSSVVFSCIRHILGYTQEELSRVLGVSSKTVSRWEIGDNKPELDFEQFHYLAYELRKHGFDLLSFDCYTLKITAHQAKIINAWAVSINN